MTINLVSLLIGLVLWFLVGWLAKWGLTYFEAPPPVRMVVMVILLILFVLWLLTELGLTGYSPTIHLGLAWPYQTLLSG